MSGLSIVWIIVITVLNHSNQMAKHRFEWLSGTAVNEKPSGRSTQGWVWSWSALPNITLDAVVDTGQSVTWYFQDLADFSLVWMFFMYLGRHAYPCSHTALCINSWSNTYWWGRVNQQQAAVDSWLQLTHDPIELWGSLLFPLWRPMPVPVMNLSTHRLRK